jgi:hypothetical protein
VWDLRNARVRLVTSWRQARRARGSKTWIEAGGQQTQAVRQRVPYGGHRAVVARGVSRQFGRECSPPGVSLMVTQEIGGEQFDGERIHLSDSLLLTL